MVGGGGQEVCVSSRCIDSGRFGRELGHGNLVRLVQLEGFPSQSDDSELAEN